VLLSTVRHEPPTRRTSPRPVVPMTTDPGLEWRFRALASPWPLMGEVAAAAGAVARSHQRVLAAASAVRAEVESEDWDRKPAGDIEILSIEQVDALWVAVADMLTWVRTVEDRTSRQHGGKELGLLATLPAGKERNRVDQALQEYRAAGAGEARRWAAESLHVMSVPAAISPAIVVWSDQRPHLTFPFPDEAGSRADAQREPGGSYHFTDGRDAVDVANKLMTATETFMSRVLGSMPRTEP